MLIMIPPWLKEIAYIEYIYIIYIHILKEICYMTTSFPAIHYFYYSVIYSRERLKRPVCQGHCVYFTTLIATIYYNKRSVVDSRKIEEYVYFRNKFMLSLCLIEEYVYFF